MAMEEPETTGHFQASGTTCDFYSVFFTDAMHGYAVGDFGLVQKTTDGAIESISVLPNPNKGIFCLKLPENTGFPVTVEISELTGRIISNLKFQAGESLLIDLNPIASGIYLMHIRYQHHKVIRKIVIAR